ncbi:Hint domain-containing protein [Oceanomicrobium pacificus]|uniref:Calcium-binding protein n=1 Tax=Oceanomicrobium pacificus TaxID=2692916 RepID=A0A6B0TRX1_9RHOB|nr:Hint domain-containing protein [Oceanomicrobium pacificus]MXU66726.1 calcium-binding protein [Oceanomicrobium pacificus]
MVNFAANPDESDLVGSVTKSDLDTSGQINIFWYAGPFPVANVNDSGTFEIFIQPSVGTATVDDNGNWTYDLGDKSNFILNGSVTFTIRGTETNPGDPANPITVDTVITINFDVCFVTGTRILTPDGWRRVEDLTVGDSVTTLDGGPQVIRWIEGRDLDPARLASNPELCPIRIKAGTFGAGRPERDLRVSPQHRVLFSGPQAQLLFGQADVLVAAKSLLGLPGVSQEMPEAGIGYFHILLDRHEVLIAEGLEAESLYLGEEALSVMGSDGLQELAAIFGDATPGPAGLFGPAARHILRDYEARSLVALHKSRLKQAGAEAPHHLP